MADDEESRPARGEEAPAHPKRGRVENEYVDPIKHAADDRTAKKLRVIHSAFLAIWSETNG